MKRFLILLLLSISIKAFSQNELYKEQYRPRYHFSPAKNWCNDPNGLVYSNGTYHLFYQYNPFANSWGHMTWAHATSKDLLHWKHQPIAIPEENGVMIFSGSCVVDKKNTSGFANKPGQVPMVAIYTGHTEGVNQSQHVAYSLDNGLTWTKYKNNPILDLHKKDFRDPKVFWYEPGKYWVMCVMLPVEHLVQFYSSQNLINWMHLSDFGPAGDTSGVWECPDLTLVPVEGVPGKKKWVLQMSMNASMQYFVGEFDGVNFVNENPSDNIFRPDYGPDYYAAICYNQLPDSDKPTAIGWVNNWFYANDIPTAPWKGAMSLPRTLSVKKINGEWILIQQPLELLNKQRKLLYTNRNVIFTHQWKLKAPAQQQYELDIDLRVNKGEKGGVRIAAGHEHALEIGVDAEKQLLYLDRSKTAGQSFNKNFQERNYFEIPYSIAGAIELKIFVDHSIVEVFVDGGKRVFTAQFFPDEKDTSIEIFSKGNKAASTTACYLYALNAVW